MYLDHPFTITVIVAFLWLAAPFMQAQDAVRCPPVTTAARGSIVNIPITGTNTSAGVMRVEFEYPSDVIRVLGASGSSQSAYTCPTFVVSADTAVGATTRRITVLCWDVVPMNNGLLFTLQCEFLYGPGTSGVLTPVRLQRGDLEVSNAVFSSGILQSEGSPALPNGGEGITGNFPNPFYSSSTFVFNLRRADVVRLSVRNMQGRLVRDLGTMNAQAGENVFEFVAEEWELAQGPYLMTLEVNTSVYTHPFMVLR